MRTLTEKMLKTLKKYWDVRIDKPIFSQSTSMWRGNAEKDFEWQLTLQWYCNIALLYSVYKNILFMWFQGSDATGERPHLLEPAVDANVSSQSQKRIRLLDSKN